MPMTDEDIANFESQFDSFHVEVEVDVSTLTDVQLMDRLQEIDDALALRGELLKPLTQEGRDLHSLRAAVVVHHHLRGLL